MRTVLVSILLLGFVVLACAGGSPSRSNLEPNVLLSQIRSRGAAKIVEELYAPGGRWSSVMAEIYEGSADWLTVASALRPGTDGGASEELDEAVFLALGRAPEAVLGLLKRHEFRLAFVCSANIEVDYSVDESRRFIEERLRALGRVNDPALAETRTQCELGLRDGLRDLGRVGAEQ